MYSFGTSWVTHGVWSVLMECNDIGMGRLQLLKLVMSGDEPRRQPYTAIVKIIKMKDPWSEELTKWKSICLSDELSTVRFGSEDLVSAQGFSNSAPGFDGI